MLVLGFLITWFVAGMLINVWLTPNQSIAVGAIIALIITVFSATARRTVRDSSAGRIPYPSCRGGRLCRDWP
jgi:NhaP-type Na+/H+ or K+/H+ antiporter